MGNLNPDRFKAFMTGADAAKSAKSQVQARKATPSSAAQADDRPATIEEAATMESQLGPGDIPAPPFGQAPVSDTRPTFEELMAQQSMPLPTDAPAPPPQRYDRFEDPVGLKTLAAKIAEQVRRRQEASVGTTVPGARTSGPRRE